ncbi:MAG: hypothetical protein ACK4NX_00460, partial [Candidatus Paceibacteria bacterium]
PLLLIERISQNLFIENKAWRRFFCGAICIILWFLILHLASFFGRSVLPNPLVLPVNVAVFAVFLIITDMIDKLYSRIRK